MPNGKLPCGRGCKHGGVCTLERGHEGKHSASGYCEYDDTEAVSDTETDRIAIEKNPGMAGVIGLQRALEASIEEETLA